MDVALRRLGPDDWQTWRDARLALLADAPWAFGSTLAREQAYDEDRWRAWMAVPPSHGVKVVATEPGGAIAGAAGGWLPENRGGAAELYSMWVAPPHRRRGVAALLAEEVVAWARAEAHPRLDLWVVGDNTPARSLYERLGFRETDERQPYPPDPTRIEYVMTLPL